MNVIPLSGGGAYCGGPTTGRIDCVICVVCLHLSDALSLLVERHEGHPVCMQLTVVTLIWLALGADDLHTSSKFPPSLLPPTSSVAAVEL